MKDEEDLPCVDVHTPMERSNDVGCDSEHDHSRDARSTMKGDRKLVIAAMMVTVSAMVAEMVFGFITGSLALLSDSMHMLTHLISLGIALGAMLLATMDRDFTRTFGLYRAEVLAALINGLGLLLFSGFILYEAYKRLNGSERIDAGPMLVVAVVGLAANLITAYLLLKARRQDLNLKGAVAHMLADTLSSGAVIAVGIVLLFTDWFFLDAVVSALIAVIVAFWSFGIMRDSVRILLELTPKDMDLLKVKKKIMEIDGVTDVHDIHAWEITTGMRCLTSHVCISERSLKEDAGAGTLVNIKDMLRKEFSVVHTTLQLECLSTPRDR